MVADKFPEVNLIANQDNPGFSKANNQAMSIAKGEYFLLLNPDTVVEEDTFQKCIDFMDTHPEAGGLGVKMIDGKGVFLPESKRGLPTPGVAFYKIFGLSALFPRSKKFGRYHLGFLSKDEIHEVEILSGAFMLMRKETLDKVGLLDEDFFMYGEDIDLSYRIILGGYKNYYFPETRIIHYKGESTKKSSVNYVFVFYNAMIIFAKKHFSEKNAKMFSFLIKLAIYLRAGMAIFSRFIKRISFPFLDFCLTIGSLFLITYYYQRYTDIRFPKEVLEWALPLYSFIWIFSSYIAGGYDKPIKPFKNILGILFGTGFILAIYGLLPKTVQFSRGIILLGAAASIIITTLSRLSFQILGIKGFQTSSAKKKKFIIAGDLEEIERIENLLLQTAGVDNIIKLSVTSSSTERYDGNLNQLSAFIDINKVDEVIFCAKDLSAQEIIEKMSSIKANREIDYKIAQPNSLYLIGSNSIHTSGDLYLLNINNINKPNNARNKRIVDLFSSILLIISIPILIFIVKNTGKFINNLFFVLIGKKTWVGYEKTSEKQQLPSIKKGIISISDNITEKSEETVKKMNLIYAKDYSIITDLKTIFGNLKLLGK